MALLLTFPAGIRVEYGALCLGSISYAYPRTSDNYPCAVASVPGHIRHDNQRIANHQRPFLGFSSAAAYAIRCWPCPPAFVQISAITLLPLPPGPVTSKKQLPVVPVRQHHKQRRQYAVCFSVIIRHRAAEPFPEVRRIGCQSLSFCWFAEWQFARNDKPVLLSCGRNWPNRVSKTPLLKPIRFRAVLPITGRPSFIVSTADLIAFCE